MKKGVYFIALLFILISCTNAGSKDEILLKKSENPELFAKIVSGEGSENFRTDLVDLYSMMTCQYMVNGRYVYVIAYHFNNDKGDDWAVIRSQEKKVEKISPNSPAYSDGVLLKREVKKETGFPPVTVKELKSHFLKKD